MLMHTPMNAARLSLCLQVLVSERSIIGPAQAFDAWSFDYQLHYLWLLVVTTQNSILVIRDYLLAEN